MLRTQEIICRVYCGILLNIWILVPYAILQHVEIREVYWMPVSSLDSSIPLNFYSLWFYLSFFPVLGVVGLTVEKRVFIRFLYTVGWATMVAHMTFLFFPNGVSRESVDIEGAPAMYRWLASVDMPRNAFPSLHAALAVIAGMAVQASRWKSMHGLVRGVVKSVTWLWVLGVFWSTIALRQHVSVDLIAGAVIAVVVWFWMKNSWEMKYHEE